MYFNGCLSTITESGFLSQGGVVHFSIIRLLVILVWFYLCLYFVQVVQFSPYVSIRFRTVACLLTMVLGPLFILLALGLNFVSRLREGHNVGEVISGMIEELVDRGRKIFEGESEITLLDNSGRDIKDVYGRGSRRKGEGHVLRVTEDLILRGIEERASDILIDPRDRDGYSVRFRVDGVLLVVEDYDVETAKTVINSVKAVSSMDIAEKRRPQDGSFSAETREATVSFRVSSAGVMNGEKLSIRILRQDAERFTLETIGYSHKQAGIIREAITKPSGMILVCGPTGSGKTTTMYAMLNEIDLMTRNVITVEDPIEYILPNASQIEVNTKAGITFAKSLRSILRQDPDVICVGEIRDEDTAAIALRAAQTGHLVFATIHSNSNSSAIVRLLDLGVSPLMISAGLNLVMSQRLLRQLCDDCKVKAELSASEIEYFRHRKVNYGHIYGPGGCARCNETGYYDRMAVCDMLVMTDQIRGKIANDVRLINELRKSGDKKGASNIHKQGVLRAVQGLTSMAEIKRVIG